MYPFSNNNSAKYEPSCPFTPVTKATFMLFGLYGENKNFQGLWLLINSLISVVKTFAPSIIKCDWSKYVDFCL